VVNRGNSFKDTAKYINYERPDNTGAAASNGNGPHWDWP